MLDREGQFAVAAGAFAVAQIEFGGGAGAVHIGGIGEQANRRAVVLNRFLMPAERLVDLPPLIIRFFIGLNRQRRGEFLAAFSELPSSWKIRPMAV